MYKRQNIVVQILLLIIIISWKHNTRTGGACSVRDAKVKRKHIPTTMRPLYNSTIIIHICR